MKGVMKNPLVDEPERPAAKEKRRAGQFIDEFEIPLVRDATGHPFSCAVLKGRANYLCLRRWRRFRDEPARRPAVSRLRPCLERAASLGADPGHAGLDLPAFLSRSRGVVRVVPEAVGPGDCAA